jgi:hypothetical protein
MFYLLLHQATKALRKVEVVQGDRCENICLLRRLAEGVDPVNWTKSLQILKRTGIDWRERRFISSLYMAQSVKVRLNRGETRNVKIGRGVRGGCCLSPILFNLYSEWLTKDDLEGFGDFKIGGQTIRTVKYTDAFYNGLLKERYK